ncbi:MAG: hypothetical protein ACRD6X_07125 [Pyrinomonadaceae bacterium]
MMKSLETIILLCIFSYCTFAQSNKVIDWPSAVTEQAYIGTTGVPQTATTEKGLEIVEFKVDGNAVMPGRPFSAEGEWLRTFSVTVKNVSGQQISSIRLYFVLPEVKSDEKMSGFSLEYGKGLSTGISYVDQWRIEPGEVVELIRNEAHYTRDREGIARRTGSTNFNTVVIAIAQIQFNDGKIWSSYKLPFVSKPVSPR